MSDDVNDSKKKFKIIEPFLKKEKKLKEIEKESNTSYATLKRWIKSYKTDGIKGLSKKERVDKNNYKKIDSIELNVIQEIYLNNSGLPISKLYQKYSEILNSMSSIISYPTFYRIINNLDSYIKESSQSHFKRIEKKETSFGIFQFPIFFPIMKQKETIFYLTLYFEISNLKIYNFSFTKEQKSFTKCFSFIRESILKAGIYPKEIFLTDTIKEASKTNLRKCFLETSIFFLEDLDFECSELIKFCNFIEKDLLNNFVDKNDILFTDALDFLDSYILLEERPKASILEDSFVRKLDFFLLKAKRKVHYYGIRLKSAIYSNELLTALINEIVEIYYTPLDNNSVYIYFKEKFLCEAFLVPKN